MEIAPERIRYFAVGEYGDETWRPHYHIALFGHAPCWHGETRQKPLHARCCPPCDRLAAVWKRGRIENLKLDPGLATYIAGYTLKKLTAKDDERLDGRLPEFAIMSLVPGIGAGAIPKVAGSIGHLVEHHIDVPAGLRVGPKKYPLGRYLRSKLRVELGREAKAPPEVIAALEEELRPLREAAWSYAPLKHGAFGKAYASLLTSQHNAAALSLEKRQEIYGKRKKL